jgi:hypothetical protein
MSEIHRWRSGDGDPTLGSSWDSGVAPGVAATADLTFSGVALNNDTVTISGVIYTFKTTINNGVAREVYHGASATDSAANLSAAINAGAGAGTLYSTATVSHVITAGELVGVLGSSPSAGVMRATAYSFGTYANSNIPLLESTAATWSPSSNPSGGLINWASTAIALFDGVSTVACQGTGRLGNIQFQFRQTEDAEHNIGSPTVPFKWNQYNSGEHILEGGGSVYLALSSLGAVDPFTEFVEFSVGRLDGPGYLEFQQSPGRLVVTSGRVGIKQTVGQSIGRILVDGLDADVTVSSGKLTMVWSRNGRFISESVSASDIGSTTWVILGGVVQNKTPMAIGCRVFVSGGVFRLIPAIAPASTDSVQFLCSGGVLDLSESVFAIVGRLVVLPPGEVWGGVVNPSPPIL